MALLDDRRFNRTGSIARDSQLNRPWIRLHGFGAGAIAGIAAFRPRPSMRGIPQMLGSFRLQRAFNQSFGEAFEQPLFAQNIFGRVTVLSSVIEQGIGFRVDLGPHASL